jgi:hypothetical protein
VSAGRLEAYLRLLRRGLADAAQWRLALWWILLSAVPTLALALPLVAALDGQLDTVLHSVEMARDQIFVLGMELAFELRHAGEPLAGAGIVAGLLWLFLVPLLNAMFLVAARAPVALRLGELLRGALANYWRMLRLGLFALVPVGIALGTLGLLMKALGLYSEHAILEADVDHLRWLALAVGFLLFAWASAGIDAGRAWLALHPSKRSAFKALWRGCKLVLRHPLRGIGIYLGVAVPALIALALLALLRLSISTAGDWGMLGGLLLTQVLVALCAWMHYARQFAMLAWLRAVELP